MPNNRQWAILIWMSVAIVMLLRRPDLRSSLLAAARMLLTPKLVAIWLTMAAHVGGLVFLGYSFGVWSWDLATDTVVWFLGSALVLLFRVVQDKGDSGFFRRTAIATVRWTILVEFFMNVRVFSLPVELLLQPLLFLVLVLASFAESKPEYAKVKRLLDALLAFLGLALFTVITAFIIRDWDQLDPTAQVLSLALPIWLTLGFLPFLALVPIWFRLDHIYVHLRSDTNNRRNRFRGMTAIVVKLGFDQGELRAFVGYWPGKLAQANTYDEAKQVVADFIGHRDQEAVAERERKRQQEVYKGTTAIDPDGRRYDRRGFDDAKTSLMTLASFQFGHFRRTGRYATTVADFLPSSMAHLIKVDPDRMMLNTNKSRTGYWLFLQAEADFHFGIAGRDGEHPTWLYARSVPPVGGIESDDWRHVIDDPAHVEW